MKHYQNAGIDGGYGIALGSTLIAFLIRWFLDFYLQDALPFVTFLIAIVVTTWNGGVGASVVAFALGGLLSNWFFVSPRYEFSLTGPIDQAGMAVYLTVSFAMIGFVQTWRWAWKRTEEMAEELRQELTHTRQRTENQAPVESPVDEPALPYKP